MASVSKASWDLADEKKLIEFFFEHRASAGDGGSFRRSFFQEISNILTSLCIKGGLKTVKACQNKWNSLKQTYRVILALQSVSGWTWDDKKGCNITPELESSWAAYVKVHKQAAPFKKE
ncbi:hypothetical protein C0992_012657, partial [Termitomyces sp. T32_za158]